MYTIFEYLEVIKKINTDVLKLKAEYQSGLSNDNPWKARSAALLRKALDVNRSEFDKAHLNWSQQSGDIERIEYSQLEILCKTYNSEFNELYNETQEALGPMWKHYTNDQLFTMMTTGII